MTDNTTTENIVSWKIIKNKLIITIQTSKPSLGDNIIDMNTYIFDLIKVIEYKYTFYKNYCDFSFTDKKNKIRRCYYPINTENNLDSCQKLTEKLFDLINNRKIEEI